MKMVYHKHENVEPLAGWVDADWAGDIVDRKSTSGFVFKVFGNTVNWMSRKQSTVALSSTEAEYMALADAICEEKWIRGVLKEIGIEFDTPTTIYEDNQSCMKAAESQGCKRMKHIDVKYYFIQDVISKREVQLKYIPTSTYQSRTL